MSDNAERLPTSVASTVVGTGVDQNGEYWRGRSCARRRGEGAALASHDSADRLNQILSAGRVNV